jgi:hypothetical protein
VGVGTDLERGTDGRRRVSTDAAATQADRATADA